MGMMTSSSEAPHDGKVADTDVVRDWKAIVRSVFRHRENLALMGGDEAFAGGPVFCAVLWRVEACDGGSVLVGRQRGNRLHERTVPVVPGMLLMELLFAATHFIRYSRGALQ